MKKCLYCGMKFVSINDTPVCAHCLKLRESHSPNESCTSCHRLMSASETPHIWEGNVVCEACRWNLSQREKERMIVPATTYEVIDRSSGAGKAPPLPMFSLTSKENVEMFRAKLLLFDPDIKDNLTKTVELPASVSIEKLNEVVEKDGLKLMKCIIVDRYWIQQAKASKLESALMTTGLILWLTE